MCRLFPDVEKKYKLFEENTLLSYFCKKKKNYFIYNLRWIFFNLVPKTFQFKIVQLTINVKKRPRREDDFPPVLKYSGK